MLRLTLRSADDGRFLARVMDRDGFAFVLDYGDAELIADASQRLLRGFTVFRWGQLHTAQPQSPDLVPLLSELYLQEGYLVFLEEPTWPHRGHSLEDRLPGPFSAAVREIDDAGDDDLAELLGAEDDSTEIVSLADLPTIDTALMPDSGPTRETWSPPESEGLEELPTQIAPAPRVSAKTPTGTPSTRRVANPFDAPLWEPLRTEELTEVAERVRPLGPKQDD